MANQKRFPDWKPQIGEAALVPGGPANAQYISYLREDDVKAIETGHRGYSPLRLYLVNTNEDDYVFAVVSFKKEWGWWGIDVPTRRRLQDILRFARKYNPRGNFEFRATNP